jgi:uncharacterized protein (TIGR03437 family)
VYDPQTGVWSPAADMRTQRSRHNAIRLPDGKILVAGGIAARESTAEAEIYDPVLNLWSRTGDLIAPRSGAEAVLLTDGRVLLVGGVGPQSMGIIASAEIYDPERGVWSDAGTMQTPRLWHTATLLADGKVLVTGGVYSFSPGSNLDSEDLFDPGAGPWTNAGRMASARNGHRATLLPNGKVLITAGSNGVEIATAELFDPSAMRFTPTTGMSQSRAGHSATLLPSGKVLVTGGYSLASTGFNANLSTSEIYDSNTGLWQAGPALRRGRADHQTTLLASGKVLVTGGFEDWDAERLGVTAEVLGTPAPARGAAVVVSAASFLDNGSVAPDSVATIFGADLSDQTAAAGQVPGTDLGGVTVEVRDASGVGRLAKLIWVSPAQINFVTPDQTATGLATIIVNRTGQSVASGVVEVTRVAPGVFLPEGIPSPSGDTLTLNATGIRGRSSLSAIRVTIGVTPASVMRAEPSTVAPESINFKSGCLQGSPKGDFEFSLQVDGYEANVLRLRIE